MEDQLAALFALIQGQQEEQDRRHRELIETLAIRDEQLEARLNQRMETSLQAVNQKVLELERELVERHIEDDNRSVKSFSTPTAKISPPNYDGTTAWEIYKTQFQAAANANNWIAQQKVTSLVVALRGKAAELLQSLTTMDQGNYAALVHALQLRFGNEHKETEFEGDIERLTHMAYPSAPESFRKQLAAERFIEGVRGDDMRYHLRLVRPRDISEALIRALEFEASRVSVPSAPRVRLASIDNERDILADQLDNIYDTLQKMMAGCNSTRPPTQEAQQRRSIRARSPPPSPRKPSGDTNIRRPQEN
ncbi:hypothetical protein HUJ05_006686 [Dendroctonus ponderosae]|nr:hypothetical protein HUJ05_006686 [Dendroctonus ponderosae]